jgi:hypothetical protein
LFGKQAYRTYHVAADAVAGDHEAHGIDVELVYMFGDVFCGITTTNGRRRTTTRLRLKKPMRTTTIRVEPKGPTGIVRSSSSVKGDVIA